jgi:hypothetical protein
LEIDGIGGGNPLTSKVAIIGPSSRPDADVDYLFAQVKVTERSVDTSPNCGNMLSGVAPFAVEKGLVPASPTTTKIRIHNVNTGKLIDATVMTPGGQVTYEGDAAIDGVPGTAAPIHLTFLDVAGSKTGKLLPTGQVRDVIRGIEVTCIDAAMPLVIARAKDFGKTAVEKPQELDADRDFMERLNAIRIEAGQRMGLGDVSGLVIPKPVIVGEPTRGGSVSARYFMPHSCHKAFAITGAVGLATACATEGSIAAEYVANATRPQMLTIEHPSGSLGLCLDEDPTTGSSIVSVLRTARRIFEGIVFARVTETQGESLVA